MSAEELVRTFCDKVVNDRELELVDELFAEDYRLHAALQDLEVRSRDEFKQLLRRLYADLPRFQVTLDRLLVNRGVEVDAVWTIRMQGAVGRGDEPSEAVERIVGATVLLIEGGRIAGAWTECGRHPRTGSSAILRLPAI